MIPVQLAQTSTIALNQLVNRVLKTHKIQVVNMDHWTGSHDVPLNRGYTGIMNRRLSSGEGESFPDWVAPLMLSIEQGLE